MPDQYRKVACPTCGKSVEWRPENAWRPFCSERCKMIDLGEWADEKFKIPVEETDALDEHLGE
jgi:endogenous inhibitor of DNA gyrase (YacG/DUF329 family)